jgi:type I restriction enzyme S subunit
MTIARRGPEQLGDCGHKSSGVAWLGEVPAHWTRQRLKYLVQFVSGGTPDTARLEYWGGTIPWVSPKDMKSMMLIDTEDHITEPALVESATSAVSEGTVLLVVRSGILRHTIPVAVTGSRMAINQDIKGLVPKDRRIYPNYLSRFIEGHNSELLREWRKEGTTVESLELPLVADFRMVVPPRDEQRTIVAYLDRETARIDALIEKKRRQIELLNEKRAALITHAVTKGHDRNAPMKDSGIKWLGEIPAEWTVKRIKHVVQIRGGQVDPRIDEYSTMPLVAPNHLESRTGRLLDQQTAEDQGAISGKYMFRTGDVLYSKIRPELAKACIAPADGLCSADMYAMVPRPGHIAHYVLYLLLSDAFTKLAIDESMRVAMPKINREDLGELRLPVAPEREQARIVEFLSSRTGKIDGLVAKVNLSIERLREYRTALISAAVTGKIDVPEEVA